MAQKIALVLQRLSELSDSIAYDCIAGYRVLTASRASQGEIRIFAGDINTYNFPDIPIEHISRLMPWLNSCDNSVVIYYWFDGWPYLDALISSLPSRIIIRWSNGTPPWFFAPYSMTSVADSMRGFTSLLKLARDRHIEFWVNSVYTARQLAFFGVEIKRIHVVYPLSPFVTNDQTAPPIAVRATIEPRDCIRLLFVGRVAPNKGHKHLVVTASLVQQATGKKVQLTMVGRSRVWPKYDEETKALAERLLVDAVFPGELPFLSVAKIYLQSHVFLCLSEHEGFGLPVFEAMRVGLPVVATRSTAVGEFLHSHPLAISAMDYSSAAARIVAALEPQVRDAVMSWQRENVLRYYSQEIVASQIMKGLAGERHWPSFGGARSAFIEDQVTAIELRLQSQIRDAASKLESYCQLPIDSADRLVTRYDLASFDIILNRVEPNVHSDMIPNRNELNVHSDFFESIMTMNFPSNRRLLGPPLRFVRRLVLTLQVGLIYVLQRVRGEIRTEFNRIDQNLDEIRRSVHSISVILASNTSSIPANVDSTFGGLDRTVSTECFDGGEEGSISKSYRQGNRQVIRGE